MSSIPYSNPGPVREGGYIVFQQFHKLIQLITTYLLGPIQGWEGKGKYTVSQESTATPGGCEIKPHL